MDARSRFSKIREADGRPSGIGEVRPGPFGLIAAPVFPRLEKNRTPAGEVDSDGRERLLSETRKGREKNKPQNGGKTRTPSPSPRSGTLIHK